LEKGQPGLSAPRSAKRQNTLQDPLIIEKSESKTDKGDFATPALQVLLLEQHAVLIGLISNLFCNEADISLKAVLNPFLGFKFKARPNVQPEGIPKLFRG
jgi:hypothetical protein